MSDNFHYLIGAEGVELGVEDGVLVSKVGGAKTPIANGGSIPVSFNSTYGGVADCQMINDGAITSGQTALTSATGLFKAGDVGKTVLIAGAGAAGADLKSTISAYVSATQVTLADAAGGTVSGKNTFWGTDNTAAFNAALTGLTPQTVGGRFVGGGILQLAVGSYLTTGGHTWPHNVIIQGFGKQATNIVHAGDNACFTFAPAVFGDYQGEALRFLTIWGNALGTSGVGVQHGGKQQGFLYEQVVIGDYSNGVGRLLFNDTAGSFCERITDKGTVLRFNKVGEEFRRTSGNASFAYQRRYDLTIDVSTNQTGLLIGDGTNSTGICEAYHGLWMAQINLEGNNAVAVRVGAHGWVPADTVWLVQGENVNASTGVKALQVDSGGSFYPRGIHDFGIDTHQNQPTMDVTNATKYRPPARIDEALAAQGLVAQTFDRNAGAQSSSAPTAGVVVGSICQFRRGDVVQGIAVSVNANGTGVTLAKVAIRSLDGQTLHAVSADNSANFTAGSLPRAQTTVLTSAWTCPTDGAYYLEVLFVGGTPPTLLRGNGVGNGAQIVGSASPPAEQSSGGQTDMPSTHTITALGTAFWFGAY